MLNMRGKVLTVAVFLWALFISAAYFSLNVMGAESAAVLLLGSGGFGNFPFSVQNLMWLVFFVGLAELYFRYIQVNKEQQQLYMSYLPEDERTLLLVDDLGAIHKKVRGMSPNKEFFLPRLIHRIILQFQSSMAIDPANTLLNSSLELMNHEIELRYNILKYITWLIPTLGFIGTVMGIAFALAYAGEANPQDPNLLTEVTKRLALAFNTTLIALIQAVILVFIMNVIQSREEQVLNHSGQYCLDNLINRLYVPKEA